MTLSELESNPKPSLTVAEASQIMGVSVNFLRTALIQNRLPFGVGVEMSQNEFYINTVRFLMWIKGIDMRPTYADLRIVGGER